MGKVEKITTQRTTNKNKHYMCSIYWQYSRAHFAAWIHYVLSLELEYGFLHHELNSTDYS